MFSTRERDRFLFAVFHFSPPLPPPFVFQSEIARRCAVFLRDISVTVYDRRRCYVPSGRNVMIYPIERRRRRLRALASRRRSERACTRRGVMTIIILCRRDDNDYNDKIQPRDDVTAVRRRGRINRRGGVAENRPLFYGRSRYVVRDVYTVFGLYETAVPRVHGRR